MLLNLFVIAFFAATLIGTALALLSSERDDRRPTRSGAVWGSLLLITLIAAGGIAWEEMALRRFARQEGGEIRGLIMKPVPLTTDHRYTPNGREYLYRAIQLPAIVTCLLLVVAGFVSTAVVYAKDFRRAMAAVWLHTITGLAAVCIYSVWRFLTAIDLFI